jgi:hypothetical protein
MGEAMTEDEALGLLNLPRGASAAEVRRAYLDLVKVWHPDRFQSDPTLSVKADRTLRQLNEAYDLLRRSAPAVHGQQRRPPRPAPPASPPIPPRATPSLAAAIARAAVLGLVVGSVVTLALWWPSSSRTSATVPLDTAGSAMELDERARPLSGTELVPPQRTGRGTLVLQNAGLRDTVVGLWSAARFERAFYVRGGEQLTVLDIAPGTYGIRLMTGRQWTIDRFAADVSYEEVIDPATFAEVTTGQSTDRTRVTLAFHTTGDSANVRPTAPFSLFAASEPR